MSKLHEPPLYWKSTGFTYLREQSRDQRKPLLRRLPDLESFYQDTNFFVLFLRRCFFFFFLKFIFRNLYTQHGAWTHSPEIKSRMLLQVSQARHPRRCRFLNRYICIYMFMFINICIFIYVYIYIYIFLMFIFFLRERAWVGEAERGRENPKQALCCQCRAKCRAQTHKL